MLKREIYKNISCLIIEYENAVKVKDKRLDVFPYYKLLKLIKNNWDIITGVKVKNKKEVDASGDARSLFDFWNSLGIIKHRSNSARGKLSYIVSEREERSYCRVVN